MELMTHQWGLGGASVPFRPVQASNTRCCSSNQRGVPSTEMICGEQGPHIRAIENVSRLAMQVCLSQHALQ